MTINWQELNERFRKVRETLKRKNEIAAYIASYKVPWKFYKDHAPQEAIKILIEQAKED